MINLGYGSSIVTTQVSSNSVMLSIHLQSASDKRLERPYYNENAVNVTLVLNGEQLQALRNELDRVSESLPVVLQEL